jgi:hypothetical protein
MSDILGETSGISSLPLLSSSSKLSPFSYYFSISSTDLSSITTFSAFIIADLLF